MDELQQKDINVIYAEQSHSSEVITHATGRDMWLNLTTFKPCKDCALEKAKKVESVKRLWSTQKFWEKGCFQHQLFFCSHFEGKKHWPIVKIFLSTFLFLLSFFWWHLFIFAPLPLHHCFHYTNLPSIIHHLKWCWLILLDNIKITM